MNEKGKFPSEQMDFKDTPSRLSIITKDWMNLMRNCCFMFVLYVVFWGCQQNYGTYKLEKFYSSGELHYRTIVDTQSHIRTTVEYFKNGQVRSRSRSVYGELDGIVTYYHEDGSLADRMYYNNGLLHGPRSTYYNSGELQDTVTYVDGQKEGLLYYYLRSKKLKAINFFVGDSLCFKEVLIYDSNGNYDSSFVTYQPIIQMNGDTFAVGDTLTVDFMVPRDSVISSRDTFATILDSFYITTECRPKEDTLREWVYSDAPSHRMKEGRKSLRYELLKEGDFEVAGYMRYHGEKSKEYYMFFRRIFYVLPDLNSDKSN